MSFLLSTFRGRPLFRPPSTGIIRSNSFFLRILSVQRLIFDIRRDGGGGREPSI